MATTQRLQLVVEAEDKVDAALNSVQQKLGGLQSGIEKMSPAFKKMEVAGLAAFGAISAGVVLSVNAAKEAEVQMAKFNATMDTMGSKGKAAKGALLEAANAAIQLGFDDEDAANSLAKLYQRTGNVTDSQKLFAVAMDLSRAKSIDLSTATTLVNQVLSGNGKVLKQYGIDIKDSATPLEALGDLQDKVKGQAVAFSDTLEGKMQVMNIQLGNLKENIGGALIPVLTNLFVKIQPVIDKIVDWVSKNPELTQQIIMIAAAVSGLLVVIGAIGLALPPIIAGFTILAGPIGLVVLAIGALIAAGVALYLHWETIKAKATEVFTAIVNFITEKWNALVATTQNIWNGIANFFTGVWNTISEIFKFGVALAIGLVIAYFDLFGVDIVQFITDVKLWFTQFWADVQIIFQTAVDLVKIIWDGLWNWFKTMLAPVLAALQAAIGGFLAWLPNKFKEYTTPIKGAWQSFWDAMSLVFDAVWENIKSKLKGNINWVIGMLNTVIDAINKVAAKGAGAVGLSVGSISKIPLLAEGGIVNKPTLAVIGEAGPEAIIPLRNQSQFGGVGANGIVVNVTVNGDVTGQQLIEWVKNSLMQEIKQNVRI